MCSTVWHDPTVLIGLCRTYEIIMQRQAKYIGFSAEVGAKQSIPDEDLTSVTSGTLTVTSVHLHGFECQFSQTSPCLPGNTIAPPRNSDPCATPSHFQLHPFSFSAPPIGVLPYPASTYKFDLRTSREECYTPATTPISGFP